MITCTNVTKRIGDNVVLGNISVTIERNSITGVIGKNGAGKSTFLQLLAGLKKPSSGTIKINDEAPFNNLHASANTIFIYDGLELPESLPITMIFDLYAKSYENWNQELAHKLASHFTLDVTKKPRELSRGQHGALIAVIGIATRAPLTIYDEPTNGMDEAVRDDFYKAILKDYIAFPRTILFATHYVEEVENVLESIMIVHHGKVVTYDNIASLQESVWRVSGNKEELHRWANQKKVLVKDSGSKTFHHASSVIIEHKGKPDVPESFTTKSLSTKEIYLAMVNEKRGDIDDVFTSNRNE
ncbi:ABC transporter ATP-binding protein [Paenalkalicoccus suaedae]|uniref:ABC transporter ATP-binding protein n=1 Tax=Paenalkalicoccus suaedae TaxID=2592382 RepID=A0A859FG76_9BACI|nr:ABC transporter ATP-binding protein [Paenalkalicoccus suaedae]QKS71634.1 ABC transporter ATP-binding protein [Paenalkalicoccus suaedae]